MFFMPSYFQVIEIQKFSWLPNGHHDKMNLQTHQKELTDVSSFNKGVSKCKRSNFETPTILFHFRNTYIRLSMLGALFH